ncbi:hypothetical protein KM043_016582 [Ampulex compressa]|nr:hypothetical protein KM043_016582 [Ampulex compressa]
MRCREIIIAGSANACQENGEERVRKRQGDGCINDAPGQTHHLHVDWSPTPVHGACFLKSANSVGISRGKWEHLGVIIVSGVIISLRVIANVGT